MPSRYGQHVMRSPLASNMQVYTKHLALHLKTVKI
ncbi:hypothetical protein T11_8812 [Trichinella zimbabwensis]|uniref:Uncharacterized protein n=1 Tax=Trichinella zimbabwensis TaxID=268475 RepID=A0A0V1G7C0_9BILA|nr:hypothetical protein T11_8812 [Trichinella zimbabwensis]